MPGIEPGAFHMQSERSTTELHPLMIYRFIQTCTSKPLPRTVTGIARGCARVRSCPKLECILRIVKPLSADNTNIIMPVKTKYISFIYLFIHSFYIFYHYFHTFHFIHLSIHPPIYIYIYIYIYKFNLINCFVCLCIYLSICLFINCILPLHIII